MARKTCLPMVTKPWWVFCATGKTRDCRWKVNGFNITTVPDTLFAMLDFASVVALITAGSLSLQFVARRTGSTATSLYVDDAQRISLIVVLPRIYYTARLGRKSNALR